MLTKYDLLQNDKLISIKIPSMLLKDFDACVPFQARSRIIKELMVKYILDTQRQQLDKK